MEINILNNFYKIMVKNFYHYFLWGDKMLLSKFATVTWNGVNKKYYESKGYIFTKFNDKFPVKIEDLSDCCTAIVDCKCDVCYREFSVPFGRIAYRVKNNLPFSCGRKCGNKLSKITNLKKYGCEKPMQCSQFKEKALNTYKNHYDKEINPEGYQQLQEKLKATSRERYGCDYPWQNPNVKNKFNNTMLERYNTTNPMEVPGAKEKQKQTIQNFSSEKKEQIQEKRKKTCIEKYQYDNVSKNPEIKKKSSESHKKAYQEHPEILEKIKATTFERYGVEYMYQNDKIMEKMLIGKKENGTCQSSKEQDLLAQILNAEQHIIAKRYLLDMVIEKNNQKYDIEYDGGGHLYYKNFDTTNYEEKRNQSIIKQGYKIIRYVTTYDIIFEDKELLSLFDFCYECLKNYDLIYINVDSLCIHDSENIFAIFDENGIIQ